MNWRSAAIAVPVVLGAVSLWLPWVHHRAAALVLTGLDLPDFVRFMGAAGAALVRPTQVAFALPLLALALSGALWAWSRRSASLWFRVTMLASVLWLASVAFSPLERRDEFVLAGGLLAATWLGAGLLDAPRWLLPAVALLGGLGGAVASIVQFARLAPAFTGLYGPFAWGAGAYASVLATAIAAALIADWCWRRALGPALRRRRSTRG